MKATATALLMTYLRSPAGSSFSSSNSNNQAFINCCYSPNMDDKEELDFDFWGANETQYYDTMIRYGEALFEEEEFNGFSPLLLKTRKYRNESSSLSPRSPKNHVYGIVSPRSRSQAIAEGKKELMQMVYNMPETCYELSLKDIVDEQQVSQGKKEEIVVGETGFQPKSQAPMKRQRRKTPRVSCDKYRQVSRSGSMEKGTFLIKMFVPTSLIWKTKLKVENGSKVSRRSSLDRSDKYEVKEGCFLKRFLGSEAGGKSKGSVSISISSSSSSGSDSSSSRLFKRGNDGIFLGCCPFLCSSNRIKGKRHTGRIF